MNMYYFTGRSVSQPSLYLQWTFMNLWNSELLLLIFISDYIEKKTAYFVLSSWGALFCVALFLVLQNSEEDPLGWFCRVTPRKGFVEINFSHLRFSKPIVYFCNFKTCVYRHHEWNIFIWTSGFKDQYRLLRGSPVESHTLHDQLQFQFNNLVCVGRFR